MYLPKHEASVAAAAAAPPISHGPDLARQPAHSRPCSREKLFNAHFIGFSVVRRPAKRTRDSSILPFEPYTADRHVATTRHARPHGFRWDGLVETEQTFATSCPWPAQTTITAPGPSSSALILAACRWLRGLARSTCSYSIPIVARSTRHSYRHLHASMPATKPGRCWGIRRRRRRTPASQGSRSLVPRAQRWNVSGLRDTVADQ